MKREQIISDIHEHHVNLTTREIYLHSFFDGDSDGGVDYRQSSVFIKNLQFFDRPNYLPILVHMQTPGGCWDNGMAMYNAIQFTQSYVTILAYAQAVSMSGILLQSADLRVLMPDCYFMMHHGESGVASADPTAAYNYAAMQVKNCERMLKLFANRAVDGPFFKKKKSSTVATVYRYFENELRKQIDWYLDAEQTVYYGLADHVLGCKEYPDLQSLRG